MPIIICRRGGTDRGVTGDWDGWRARLFDEGLNPYLYYTTIAYVPYILRPGGTGNVPDAVLIGAQLGLMF